MANTSATGGYLSPGGAVPAEDAALDAILQQAIAGITGLPGGMVRPRWQPTVPKQPEPTANWCALGVPRTGPADFPAIEHDGTGDGQSTLHRHEEFDVLASFYGPAASGYAKTLRDGLYLAQNRAALQAAGIDLIGTSDLTSAPDLINQQWVRRYDVTLSFRRHAARTFAVLNLLSADAVLVTDVHLSVNP
ncbi:hypothetical protein LQ772_06815 [Frateuria edaphi]|uniref:phage neck terminator protein n=1 Tax=Frateuria edaphi TaxID=2898793 RepID=UPI001E2FA710|nr:hypothetical protein [Frateuria edaphi]UGB46997.1 hypothetical protein LQ772_06815 [Frateuria edaphi]